MILLDTSAIVDLAGNKEWIVHLLARESHEKLTISVISVAEIKTGKILSKNKNEAVSRFLDKLVNESGIILVDINRQIAERFAQIQSQLLAKGLALSPFDGLIAATAMYYKATLATRDNDFQRVRTLKLLTP